MPAATLLFLNDKLHAAEPLRSIITATTTGEGSMHNVRDPSYSTWWKATETAGDQYLRCESGASSLGCKATNLSATLTSDGAFWNVKKGDTISGLNIPGGTFVLAIASDSSLTMSANATGTDAVPVLRTFTHTGWIGDDGDTAYVVVMYDARGADQVTMNLRYFPADDFAAATTFVTFTLDKTRPTIDYASFTIPSNSNNLPKRRYELVQKDGGGDRPAGEKTARIFYWGMFGADDFLSLDNQGNKTGPGPGRFGQRLFTGRLLGPGGMAATTQFGYGSQPIVLEVLGASEAMYDLLRNRFQDLDGKGRGLALAYDGLLNGTNKDNLALVRATDDYEVQWNGPDNYDLRIPLETEAYF